MPLKSVSITDPSLVAGITACSDKKTQVNRVRDAAWNAQIPGGEHLPRISGDTVTVKVPAHADDQKIKVFKSNLEAAFVSTAT